MSKYKEIINSFDETIIEWNDNGVIRFIPTDKSNSQYQRYLRWLENPDADEAQSL